MWLFISDPQEQRVQTYRRREVIEGNIRANSAERIAVCSTTTLSLDRSPFVTASRHSFDIVRLV